MSDAIPIGAGYGGKREPVVYTCGNCRATLDSGVEDMAGMSPSASRVASEAGWRRFAWHSWRCPQCQLPCTAEEARRYEERRPPDRGEARP